MKKTIKKLTAVGLTLTSVMGLVACGSSNDSNAAGGSSSSKEVTKPDKFTIMCDSTVVTETNGAAAFYEQLRLQQVLTSSGLVRTTAVTMMQLLMHLTQMIQCQTLYYFHLTTMHYMLQMVSFGI